MKAVVLAGGIGSRLHPLSTEESPKQFLPLFNDKSLLVNTVERVAPVSDAVYISTRKQWVPRMLEEGLSSSFTDFIIEPCGRNTGPAIAYCISKLSDDDIVGFFPSDHFISPDTVFAQAVRAATELVKKNDTVVLFGIKPTEPCTEFGYIQHENDAILAFKEKPQEEVAKQYIESGGYLWNSGMFFFRVGKMKTLFKKYAKQISDWLEHRCTDEAFTLLDKESIDYAVMEKAGRNELQVVPCSFTWSDLGTFTALEKLLGSPKVREMLEDAQSQIASSVL